MSDTSGIVGGLFGGPIPYREFPPLRTPPPRPYSVGDFVAASEFEGLPAGVKAAIAEAARLTPANGYEHGKQAIVAILRYNSIGFSR